MATTTERHRALRGRVVSQQSTRRSRLAAWWQDHGAADWGLAALIVVLGLFVTAVGDLWSVVGAEARQELGFVALVVLGGVTALILAAVSFGWTLNVRGRTMTSRYARSKLKETWVSVLIGTAAGLLVLGLSWAGDVAFGWGWLGWVALGAFMFVVGRTARALWLLTALLGLTD